MPWVCKKQMKTVKQILIEYAKENNISYKNDDDLINKTMDFMFDFEMPSFAWVNYSNTKQFGDETYYLKKTLLQNYMYDVIGFRDVDRFKSRLQNALRILLPYYNQILWAEQWPKMFIKDPSANTDYREIYTRIIDAVEDAENTNTTANNSTTESNVTNTENITTTSNGETNGSDSTSASTTTDATNHDESNQNSKTTGNSIDNDLPKVELTADEQEELDFGKYASMVNNTSGYSDGNTTTDSKQTSKSNTESTTTNQSTSQDVTVGKTTNEGVTNSQTIDNIMTKFNGNTKNKTNEQYEYRRVGNIGIQTPGEVFRKTRQAFINTIDLLIHDKMIVKLFSFLIYDEEGDYYEDCYY